MRVSQSTYFCWRDMMRRCYNPKNSDFQNYGARGIIVAKRWHLYKNFLADMGKKPPKLTIERINNSRGYSPSNCKWATRAEQARNDRRTRKITFGGITMCLTDWSKKLGIPTSTIKSRLLRYGVKTALTAPKSQGKKL